MNDIYLFFFDEGKDKSAISDFAKEFVLKKTQEKFNIPIDRIEYCKTENGKPYIKNYPDYHFNISHSNGAVAIAFSDYPVGVDIEKIRKVDMKIVNRFFNESEKDYILNCDCDSRFTEIWTKKEAFIKKNGLTLSHLRVAQTNGIYSFRENDYMISLYTENNEKIKIFKE